MTEETRNWTQLANENAYLHEQLDQARLEQAEDKTRVYQTTGDGVEVDYHLAFYMYDEGWRCRDKNQGFNMLFKDACSRWKAQQGD